MSNSTMFGDLEWPLNASRGFVSISWASRFCCPAVAMNWHWMSVDTAWLTCLLHARWWSATHGYWARQLTGWAGALVCRPPTSPGTDTTSWWLCLALYLLANIAWFLIILMQVFLDTVQ